MSFNTNATLLDCLLGSHPSRSMDPTAMTLDSKKSVADRAQLAYSFFLLVHDRERWEMFLFFCSLLPTTHNVFFRVKEKSYGVFFAVRS